MQRDRSPRITSLIALGATAVVGLLGLGACTSSSSGSGSSGPAPSTVSSPSGPSGPSGSPTGSAAPSSGARSATTSPARSGSSTRSLPTADPSPLTTVPTSAVRTLHPVSLHATAAFGTGVTAQVTSVTHGTDHDKGPGAAAGRPTVLFHLRLTNGSTKSVPVSDVQVLATYGSSSTPAIAATSSTEAFSGSLRPGHSAGAVYGFAVPASGQGAVALTVTYTAGQPTVLLKGSAR